MTALYLILIIPLVKLIINGTKYVQTKYYFEKYLLWVGGNKIKLNEMQYNIVKLFKDAGIPDHYFSDVIPLGYGHVQSSTNISLFQNLTSRRKEHVKIVWNKFHLALGTYKTRTLETFNPAYWLEIIVYLPKHLAAYLGYSQDTRSVKLINIIYWIIVIAIPTILDYYDFLKNT